MSFWDYFWLFVSTFFFIAYLFVLLQIFFDLFRDSSLSGWAKAVWVLFLIVFPAITGLVYIIARGRGMTERAQARALDAKKQTDSYIREVASTSPADQIATAKKLLDDGIITADEFSQLKARALAA